MTGGKASSGRAQRAVNGLDGDIFDSFSESQEGSGHSAKIAAGEESSSLFQLLTDAANALRPPPVFEAAEPSEDARDKAQAGGQKGCSERLRKQPKSREQSPEAQGGFTGDRAERDTSQCSSECPKDGYLLDNDTSERLPSGQSPHLGLPSGLRTGDAASEGQAAKLDWDSAQEASSEELETTRFAFPAGMSRRQGSLATDSMSSLRSSTARLPSTVGSVLTDDDVPLEAFYDACSARGRRPAARWGHSAAVLGDRMFVFGGTGRGCHGDCFVFDAARSVWAQIPPSRESPAPTFGAAACSSRGRVFVFGGKQNQKPCRRLYSLDPGTLTWRLHKDSAAAPPACAEHTMTAVGQYGVYVFGGQSSKQSSQVYALDPETYTWRRVNTLGAFPPPRQGHSAIWDGADSLLVYGGHHGTRIMGDVRVLSLSTGHWSEAKCRGRAPPPRHSHAAALVGGNLMLVWGGCGDRGAVLNDGWLLNTSTFVWHELKSIGSPPSGRYCHTVSVVARRTLIFGGTDALQPFDNLVSISLDMGAQLNTLAQSLSGFSAGGMNTEGRADLLRVQLGNHLRQRHAQETSQVALTRAEIAEKLFEQERQRSSRLAAELQHVRLMLREEEAKRKQEEKEHATAIRSLQHANTLEAHRRRELQSRLQAAMATIQKQQGEAVVVDAYKAMYDRLVVERRALVERAVELEFENKRLLGNKHSREGLHDSSPSSQDTDPWADEFDRRERLMSKRTSKSDS